MAWYYGTYSCGHEGRVNVIGKMSERQWKIDRHFEGICEECKAKEREEANKKSTEKSKEYDFPELSGTEKQIAWANTIRMNFYENCMYEYVDPDDIIHNETEAKFWIDNRGMTPNFVKKYHELKEKKNIDKQLVDMDTVKPSDIKHDGVVEITKNGNKIVLHYEKNQDFIDLVKSYDYKWDDVWYREISETTGEYKDRAAEIGYALLKNGFCICIHDKEITDMAINGNYEPEHKKWILSRMNSNLLEINWQGRDNELYQKARAIQGSQYNSPSVVVDVSHYKSIEKFAEENDFKFTKEAKCKIEKYIKQMKNVKEVNIKND